MADLIEINYQILKVLSRLNLALGFGEDTVADMCRRNSVNPESFLLLCHAYTSDGFVPSDSMVEKASPDVIVRYLHSSHELYLNALKRLESTLDLLIEPCDLQHKRLIQRFYSEYYQEIVKHFEYEETSLFPYIASLMTGKIDDSYSIKQYKENHSDVEEKLGDLKSIVMKYLPEGCDAGTRNKALYHIFQLEEDILRHTGIEDNILVRIVSRIEEELNGQ